MLWQDTQGLSQTQMTGKLPALQGTQPGHRGDPGGICLPKGLLYLTLWGPGGQWSVHAAGSAVKDHGCEVGRSSQTGREDREETTRGRSGGLMCKGRRDTERSSETSERCQSNIPESGEPKVTWLNREGPEWTQPLVPHSVQEPDHTPALKCQDATDTIILSIIRVS